MCVVLAQVLREIKKIRLERAFEEPKSRRGRKRNF